MDKKGLLKKAVKAAMFTAVPGVAIGMKVMKKAIPGMKAAAGAAKAGMKAAAGVAKKVSSMRQGANANLSPATAAKRIMTDKKALKKMYPGIPGKGN